MNLHFEDVTEKNFTGEVEEGHHPEPVWTAINKCTIKFIIGMKVETI
ncbi:hypothetical protein [Falsibacillus pallidus]